MDHQQLPLELRVVKLETRVERIEDDIRSEQKNRSNSHAELKTELVEVKNHLSNQDKTLNRLIGALIVINLIWPLLLQKIFKS